MVLYRVKSDLRDKVDEEAKNAISFLRVIVKCRWR